jgi:D-aminoacyl-tRNA deacylase
MSALYALFVLPSLLVLVLVLLTIMATRLPPAAAFSSLPLIVSSDHDQASSLMLKSLLARSGWKPLQPQQQKGDGAEKPQLCTFSAAWAHSSGRALMAQLEGTMLQADEVDVSFEQQFQLPPSGGSSVSDVIFISKHKAASGTPALTAHPIGLPNPAAEAVHGGRAGMMPAPSPRLAPVLRALTRCAASAGLAGEFEVCFEATHHGPFVSRSPCMFVEIGSSEPQWGREDAAEVWATTLGELLGLDGSPQDPDMSPWLLAGTSNYVDVVVGLGGGHYTPKMGDYARKSGALVGHMIAVSSIF